MGRYEYRFAKKIYRSNKKRNVIVITTLALAIALCTMLIYFLRCMEQYKTIENRKRFGTEAEAEYMGYGYEDYRLLQESNAFEDLAYGASFPISMNVRGKTVSVSLCFYEPKAAEWGFAGLLSGSWPRGPEEIVVSQAFCDNVEAVSVGEELRLDDLTGTFKVCGISKSEENMVFYSEEKWIEKGYGDSVKGIIYVRFSDMTDAESRLHTAEQQVFDAENDHWIINSAYLAETEAGVSLNTIVILFVFSIILFFFVYSVYYFALIRDIRLYSSLRLLGMVKGQLQSIVKYQAFRQFFTGVPIGIVISLAFSYGIRMWIHWKTEWNIAVYPQMTDYLIAICVLLLAVLAGMSGPIRMMSRMSGIQAYRYQTVKKITRKGHRARKFSVRLMALRNIRRNWKRSALVGICMVLVLMVFVVNRNLMKSIFRYDDYLYESAYDFVVAANLRLFDLSKCQGIEQPKNQYEFIDRLGWGYNDKMISVDQVDKEMARELGTQCADDEVTYYFSLEAAIDDEVYEDRVKEAIANQVLEEGQEGFFQFALDYFGFLPQQQYYVDYSELEKCDLVEGSLDRELFETGRYAVLIYDEDLESDTLYHVGDEMVVGKYDFMDVTSKKKSYQDEKGNPPDRTLRNSRRKVEVMAVVKNPPQMYFVTGNNACFLPVSYADVWNDEKIMLFGITIDSTDMERTENAVRSAIGVPNPGEEYYTSYLSDATKEKQKQDDIFLYKVLCGGVGGALCIIAFMNLFNNTMLGLIERRQEFSTLHAIGMTRTQLVRMIRIENGMIMGVGGALGYGIGMLLSRRYMIAAYGERIGFTDYISYTWWPGLLLVGVIVLLSSVYPNRRTMLDRNQKNQ